MMALANKELSARSIAEPDLVAVLLSPAVIGIVLGFLTRLELVEIVTVNGIIDNVELLGLKPSGTFFLCFLTFRYRYSLTRGKVSDSLRERHVPFLHDVGNGITVPAAAIAVVMTVWIDME